MNPTEFIKNPWAKGSIHPAYAASFLHMRPAPEYASGEVVLASTYRQVGFDPKIISEGKVPTVGRNFQKQLDKGRRPENGETGTGIDVEVWRRIITGTLRSPKQPNQTAKRFLQISPVVPDASLYSFSARLSANSWNPGALVARIVQFGEKSDANAQELWNELFHSLSVNDDDDIWARFLQEEFCSWRTKSMSNPWSSPRTLDHDDAVQSWRSGSTDIPASRFVNDLSQILSLKNYLTRRQWISMVESILRLGTASHILWTCQANTECFKMAWDVLHGSEPLSSEKIRLRVGVSSGFWRYGQYASTTLTKSSTDFVKARAGLNLLLHQLENSFEPSHISGCLGNLTSIELFLKWLSEIRDEFDIDALRTGYQSVIEADQRLIAGKKGISSNVKEFLRHVLGQRQTAEPGLDSYDQGYFLAKKGSHKSARWAVGLGPVSVLALVHACTHQAAGPRTVDDFCRHLGEYGLEVESQDIPGSALGQTLRNLGLILDSPDAEGGMVIVNPFDNLTIEGAQA
jgi:hypothetical protein